MPPAAVARENASGFADAHLLRSPRRTLDRDDAFTTAIGGVALQIHDVLLVDSE
jgi:hypothetical protein